MADTDYAPSLPESAEIDDPSYGWADDATESGWATGRDNVSEEQ